jgi:hypothetical protein
VPVLSHLPGEGIFCLQAPHIITAILGLYQTSNTFASPEYKIEYKFDEKYMKMLPLFFSHKKFLSAHTKTKISDDISFLILKIEDKNKNVFGGETKWQAEAIE